MRLTNRTTPQAKNYQCNKCKKILPHKEMEDDNICIDCYMEESESLGNENSY
jgi:hypothetical protein